MPRAQSESTFVLPQTWHDWRIQSPYFVEEQDQIVTVERPYQQDWHQLQAKFIFPCHNTIIER